VPIVPLYGHHALRERLLGAVVGGTLPASLLLHGRPGIGKQRLALWLAQALLCSGERPPCGQCQHCRYALGLVHPDIHWYFPRPRLKDSDAGAEEAIADIGEARVDRAKDGGLYPPPSGLEGIFIAYVRAIVQQAALTPALGRRKVFLIGDAERMVPQEGAEQAANALLKLLEEPPADTWLVLTSSEPGALLPTIRSRVVSVRVPSLPADDIEAFLTDPVVAQRLERDEVPGSTSERVRAAQGSPGALLAGQARGAAEAEARRILDAALSSDQSEVLRTAFGQGSTRARGSFSEALEALVPLLHERARQALQRDDPRRAAGAARAVLSVERARARAAGNINPQLVAATLIRELASELRA
jgi:DNA polymerase-3 subunit delta'